MNAILRPSGDNVGSAASVCNRFPKTRRRFVPSAFAIQISAESIEYASRLPSADHAGSLGRHASQTLVSRLSSLPSGRRVYRLDPEMFSGHPSQARSNLPFCAAAPTRESAPPAQTTETPKISIADNDRLALPITVTF
jgi:hypothetical protein